MPGPSPRSSSIVLTGPSHWRNRLWWMSGTGCPTSTAFGSAEARHPMFSGAPVCGPATGRAPRRTRRCATS
jgi:hypothetical protein